MARFVISISAGVELTTEDVWPDGGAPDSPTDEDVAEEMRAGGSKLQVLREWSLLDDASVLVGPIEVRR